MNNKKTIIIAVVLIAISFFAGSKYSQREASAASTNSRTAFAGGGAGFRGLRGGANGGGASGEVISKDSQSITVKMRDGSSKIIFVGDNTPVMKAVSGSLSDIKVGSQITSIGTTNSDGSITAQSIQIHPATTTQNQ